MLFYSSSYRRKLAPTTWQNALKFFFTHFFKSKASVGCLRSYIFHWTGFFLWNYDIRVVYDTTPVGECTLHIYEICTRKWAIFHARIQLLQAFDIEGIQVSLIKFHSSEMYESLNVIQCMAFKMQLFQTTKHEVSVS